MPPRYAYWTILVDNQPTAFRAGAKEDLLPTFNRLKEKHASATMMWFQNGKLWPSRLDAQEAMRARGEKGRRGDAMQGGGFRDRFSGPRARKPSGSEKLEWKPKGHFTPAPKQSERLEWKPKKSFDRDRKPDWKPKSSFDRHRQPEWKAETSRTEKLEWKPKSFAAEGRESRRSSSASEGGRAKRAWIPKEEYKKAKGIEAPRDSKWRPGGEHRDPRQKYKDAKKAKWSRFKQNIRQSWEKKQGRKKDDK